ncbi:MAG: preprotein translocase subunit SecE [Pseudomonadota bacterium]
MNAKVEPQSSAMDPLKWIAALAIVAGGVYGFYALEAQVLTPVRVVGLLLTIGLALFVAALTTKGRSFLAFMREANIERQKVVWPTRNETLQTTLAVVVVVILVGLLIWLLDWVFGGLVSLLVG